MPPGPGFPDALKIALWGCASPFLWMKLCDLQISRRFKDLYQVTCQPFCAVSTGRNRDGSHSIRVGFPSCTHQNSSSSGLCVCTSERSLDTCAMLLSSASCCSDLTQPNTFLNVKTPSCGGYWFWFWPALSFHTKYTFKNCSLPSRFR